MRIIHTSDWHLGRQFGSMSLRADQEAFTDWLVDLVVDAEADLVVVAGDLYDRAIAPVEAIELFRDTVRRILSAGVVVAAITGNHDGADRVAPYAELFDGSSCYLRGGYEGIGRVITHQFADGPLDLVLLPFLDPQAAPDELGADDGSGGADGGGSTEDPGHEVLIERRRRRTHESVLVDATRLARADLRSPRSLAVAHAYVTGATTSESERQLVVGGAGDVASTVFDGFSYTALGHLHRPQAAGADTIRYSGTPLAYSFSEEHEKSVVLVDLAADGTAKVDQVPVPVGRKVRTITGEMAHLLGAADLEPARDCFVRAIVTDSGTVLDAKARLAERFPHVAEIRLMPGGRAPELGAAPQDVSAMPPIEAARQFWSAAEGDEPSDQVDAVLVAATTAATSGAAR